MWHGGWWSYNRDRYHTCPFLRVSPDYLGIVHSSMSPRYINLIAFRVDLGYNISNLSGGQL